MATNKSSAPDSHRSIIRSTSILSLGTLASRILGFFRDVILAKLLGTGPTADAFFVAFKITRMLGDAETRRKIDAFNLDAEVNENFGCQRRIETTGDHTEPFDRHQIIL